MKRGADSNRAYGKLAEESAAAFLREQGFAIVAANFQVRLGELDLVATEGRTLCFVEVKARRTKSLVSALESVTPRKQRRIQQAAERWLMEHPHDGEVRFDVVHRDTEAQPWQLVRDAFRAEAL